MPACFWTLCQSSSGIIILRSTKVPDEILLPSHVRVTFELPGRLAEAQRRSGDEKEGR